MILDNPAKLAHNSFIDSIEATSNIVRCLIAECIINFVIPTDSLKQLTETLSEVFQCDFNVYNALIERSSEEKVSSHNLA